MAEKTSHSNNPVQSTSDADIKPNQQQPTNKTIHKAYLTFIILLLLIIAGMYVWKIWSDKKLDQKFNQEKLQLIEKYF